tara:strand:+ start:241 stop:654 length:414 start_codon:yes stop_codon:yes gene_type:complete
MKLTKNEDFYDSVDKIIYWSKLFAVLMIIGGAFFALFALIGLGMGSTMSDAMGIGIGAGAIFIIYALLAALYLVPGIWLLNFSNKSRQGLNNDDEGLFVEGFVHLGKYYKFWGVTTSIILGLYLLIFLVGVITAAAS